MLMKGRRYPDDNCAAMFNTGGVIVNPQDALPTYLTHDAHKTLLAPYLNSTLYAQSVNKPFLMFETNTVRPALYLSISISILCVDELRVGVVRRISGHLGFVHGRAVGTRLRTADGALEFLRRDVPSGWAECVL
jgi:hypothetical protein